MRREGDSSPVTESKGTWIDDVGPAFLVEGSTPDDAIAVGPQIGEQLAIILQPIASDSTPVILFGREGSQFNARLGTIATRRDSECVTWPIRDAPPTGWSIGFFRNGMKPVPLDSVDILSQRDSMTLVAEVSRLASAVMTPSGPSFQGLRFTAHDIRRFEAAPGIQALVAHVIRRVNQEANPQEEQTLLIAERDSGAAGGAYRLVYAERTSGLEDQVTTPEVIAAILKSGRTSLIIARDNESGIAYSFIERMNARSWQIRWTSRPTSCG